MQTWNLVSLSILLGLVSEKYKVRDQDRPYFVTFAVEDSISKIVEGRHQNLIWTNDKFVRNRPCLLFLVSLIAFSCTSNKIASRYCFKGDSFSSLGRVYGLSKVSFDTNSKFQLSDYFFESRKARQNDKHYKVESFKGEFKINGDTVVCTVMDTSEHSGREYLFLVQGSRKISMLDRSKMIIQKWHSCSIAKTNN